MTVLASEPRSRQKPCLLFRWAVWGEENPEMTDSRATQPLFAHHMWCSLLEGSGAQSSRAPMPTPETSQVLSNYPSPSPHHMPPCLVAYLSYTSHRHAILCFRTNAQDGVPMRYSDDLFDLVCLPCHPMPPMHRVTCLCRGFVEVRS